MQYITILNKYTCSKVFSMAAISMVSVVLFCISPFIAIGQSPIIDSLKRKLAFEESNALRAEILMRLIERNFSLAPDTFYTYLVEAEKLTPHHTPEYFMVKNYFCTYYSKTGNLEAAIKLNDSLLMSVPVDKKFERASFQIQNARSVLLTRNNHVKESIEQSLKSLQQAEDAGDTLYMLRAYILLGYANMEVENFNEAIKWLNKGYSITKNENILKHCGFLFSNNASCYNNIGKPDSAFYFLNLALKYARMGENLSVEANALNIRADMFIKQKDFEKAEADLQDALAIRKKTGDILMLVSDMGQLATFYASINQTNKGIEIAKNGIRIIKTTNNLPKLLYLYQALADNYMQAKRWDDYSNTLESIIALKDSLNQRISEQAIAEMAAKYELEKKEKIILKQDLDLQRSRSFSLLAFGTLVLGVVITILFYKNRQHRQKLKTQLAIAEQKKLSQEAVYKAEENERKRIAADLHDNLGAYAAAISSNVRNLKENASESDNENIVQLEQNAQNMVMQLSDTIWVLKTEHLPITDLADRFKTWIQRLIKNYPGFKYYYEEEIENDFEFSPSEILHLFLMLKECVNNALKHSKGSELRIRVVSNSELKIAIEDNGTGFDPQLANQPSGIQNIVNRAKECNWKVVWEEVVPTGTRVVLTANTTN